MTDILYKYRTLNNYKYFVDIILKNRLYASKYKDLNDPMEGQYLYGDGELNETIRDKLRNDKGDLRICSLSRTKNNELMWSHYTNGQRGVAIGVRIDNLQNTVKPVQYKGIAKINANEYNDQTAIEILSNKLGVWEYEQEERAFIRGKHYINVEVIEIITGRVMSPQDYSFLRELVQLVNPNIKIIKAETVMK